MPAVDLRRPWPLWLGLATGVAALTCCAVQGFAHEGRLPVLPALSLTVGTTLVMANRRTTTRRTSDEPRKLVIKGR
ncbi:hypothetical protein [Streptomyces sp. NPDC058620]|uniref:hypothetical protein n=1 Tax=Streptomyces sp. NPDC058620 TaxID=3346560 RepID=UPI0036480C78